MAHVQFTDELVKEYLLFRGFTSSLKAFENDLKNEKDKGFRVDKIVDNFLHSVYNYDLTGLREAWNHLETKIFTRLEHHNAGAARKLENALYKFYLVHVIENNKTEKVTEFFTKMTHELSGQPDWKDWFTIPYVRCPEENPMFAVYFTRQWQDSLFVSLHNFFAAAYQSLPQPTLTAYEEAASKISSLQKENEMLRRGLANLLTADRAENDKEADENLSHIIDDFHNISMEVRAAENQANFMKLLKNRNSASPTVKSLPGTSLKKSFRKRNDEQKRPSSSEGKQQAARRDRESSLDPAMMRARLDKTEKDPEGSFLFLSQDEYNEHSLKEILCLKLNGRGNMVASVDALGSLRIWSTPPSCRTVASFNVRPETHILEWVLHHERYLLCADAEGFIKLLDTRDKLQVWEVPTNDKLSYVVSSPAESLALIITSGKLSILDLKTRKLDTNLDPGGEINCCAFTPRGDQVVCGRTDGTAVTLDLKKNEILDVFSCCEAPIRFVHLIPDSTSCFFLTERLLICYPSVNKENVQRFNLPDEAQMPSAHNKPFCLDSSGSFLLTLGTHSGVIYKIVPDGLTKCLKLGGHKTTVTVIDWSFANQCATCVTASKDGSIRISTLLIDSVGDS